MKALQIKRSPMKFGLARLTSPVLPAKVSALDYRSVDDPDHPGDGWQRFNVHLAGICGSDLSLVEGHASAYFEDYVSFPFVPGHEVVGSTDDGTRYVLNPVLNPAARGVPHAPADDYAHYATGNLEPGIQTGFCCSTGGGWAPWLWAHESQLHPIPDDMPDERAVLVEPLAGGIHAALLAWPHVERAIERGEPAVVVVLGAGTMGLAAIAGLRRYLPAHMQIIAGARYPHQIALAKAIGANEVVQAAKLDRAVRRATACHLIGDGSSAYLSSGAHVTIDAVGTSESITDALRITRPRGRVVLLGMPADVKLDLTGLWHRETEIKGAYTYGTETLPDGSTATTFDLAVDTANHYQAERLLSATYRLDDHVDALAHAAAAGRRGAVKIAFDLRKQ
ncbi:MAG TPA: medium chain dehydrogenase/reductase family protein [Ilumatobacter sp.]|nr:medium chain dehydrogenase/reductase family protein [Ilumatobacter sp.]